MKNFTNTHLFKLKTLLIIILFCFSIESCAKQSQVDKDAKGVATIQYGKYGCTASKYVNGFYEFIPRGSFILSKNGTYSYLGFENPSNGKFIVEKNGDLSFEGGYLDKGKAEKTDNIGRFLVVFPSNPDNRWTCSVNEE